MTLRHQMAALAVAGLTLSGSMHSLLAQQSPTEAKSPAAAGRWNSVFTARKKHVAPPSPGDHSRSIPVARQMEQRGETAAAEKLYQAALRENPDDGVIHHRLGVLLAKRGELARAEEQLRAAVRQNPDSAEAANDLGYCYYLQGRFAEAETSLRRALEINPSHQMAANNLGAVLRKRAAHGVANEPADCGVITATSAAAREPVTASRPIVPDRQAANATSSPEPELIETVKAPAVAERSEAAEPPPSTIETSPGAPVRVAKQPATEDSLIVVLPEPASEPPSLGADSGNIRRRTFEATGAIRDDSATAALPAASELGSLPDQHKTATTAKQEDTPPAEVELVAQEVRAADERHTLDERASAVKAARTTDDSPVESALVELVSEDRFAPPCPSPDAPPRSHTPEPAHVTKVEVEQEEQEEIRIVPSPVVHPVTGGRVEAADESFVPYQPAVATTATGESGATPRQSLFSTARLVPHGGLPLIGNSFNSRPPADQAETRSAHAPTPSPQTGQPRPARRSLLTTLRLLNPFDEPK